MTCDDDGTWDLPSADLVLFDMTGEDVLFAPDIDMPHHRLALVCEECGKAIEARSRSEGYGHLSFRLYGHMVHVHGEPDTRWRT